MPGHVRFWLGVVSGLVFASLVICAPGSPASAHARLAASDPVSGSALPDLPPAINLEFSEPIVPDRAEFALFGPEGPEITLSRPTFAEGGEGVQLGIVVVQPLSGTYTLAWNVTSATDGHDSSGTILFTVGTGRAPVGVPTDSEMRSPWWQIGLRGLWLGTLGVICALILTNGLRTTRLLAFTSLAGAFAFLTILADNDFSFGQSTADQLKLLAGLFTLAASVILWWAFRIKFAAMAATVVWLGAVCLLAASGHAAGVSQPVIATVIAAVHMVFTLTWFGLLLGASMRMTTNSLSSTGRNIATTATAGLVLVIATGILSAAILLPDQRSVTATAYGKTLAIKTLVVVLVLAIAATNRWIVPRWTNETGIGPDRQTRWILTVEAALLLVAILFGATLSNTSPPDRFGIVQVAAPVQTIDQESMAGDLTVSVNATITGTVDDIFRIQVTGPNGSPVDVQRLIVETAAVMSNGQPVSERFDADPVAATPGQFTIPATRLGLSAIWNLHLIVRQSGHEDVAADFQVDTTAWTVPAPTTVERSWTLPIIPPAGFALLILALVVAIGGLAVLRRQSHVAPLSGAIIIVALAMIATGFIIQAIQRSPPRTSGHELTAPVDTDLIAAQVDYQTLCLACHGPGAVGLDTLDPNHQHGSGTNLVDPRTQALSDGDLFTLISGGTPGTDMPAFSIALTDDQRWGLVAYLRELQDRAESATPSADEARFEPRGSKQ